jgi:hypothetical protein
VSTVKSNGKPNVESPSEASSVTASVTVPIITDEVEDRVRRQRAEAERLASLLPVEAELYLEDRARALDMPPAKLKAAVEAVRKDRKEKTRKAEVEARRQEERAAKSRAKVETEKKKTKEREFKVIDSLPEAEQAARLAAVARRLGEDPAAITEEFAVASTPPCAAIEPWPDKVETAEILSELIKQIQRYIAMNEDAVIATALWAVFDWIHGIATHSPILAITSAEIDSGKSALANVLRWVTPRAHLTVDLTGSNLFRKVDREHPTMIIEEAERIFSRRPDLAEIVNTSWTRGATVSRHGHDFDIFCPKVVTGNRLSAPQVPDATVSRFIRIEMKSKRPDEVVEAFDYLDKPEFVQIRRKLARWSADKAATLAEAKPDMADFNNRQATNWKLLFAIADDAAGKWPKRARQAAIKISRDGDEPSQGRRLLAAIYVIFLTCIEITSAEMVLRLNSNLEDEWCEYRGRGAPLTQHQLAVLLRGFGIRSVPLHPTKRSNLSLNGYKRSQFEDVFARYLPTHITQPKKAK